MDWDSASKVAVSVLAVVAAGLQLRRGRGSRRTQIKEDLEILALMPEGSSAREALSSHIDGAVQKLIQDEDSKTRDPAGMVLGGCLAVVGLAATYFAGSEGGWWLAAGVPAFFVFVIGLFGFATDVTKKVRDEKGRALT